MEGLEEGQPANHAEHVHVPVGEWRCPKCGANYAGLDALLEHEFSCTAPHPVVLELAAGLSLHVPKSHDEPGSVVCPCDPHLVMTEDQWCLHAARAMVPQL